jgi:hypothetical protein
MPSLVSDNFRVFAAEQFIESLEEPYESDGTPSADNTTAAYNYRSKIYLFVGRPQNWTLERYVGRTDVTEFEPPDAYDSFNDMNEVYDDMIAVKRVTRSDVSQVIRKRTWKSGIIYDMYKNDYTPEKLSVNGQSKLYDSQFYVMNSNYQVYKCIYNGESPTYPNGRPSTVEPTGNSTSIIDSTSDGYRWKYMYTINISEYIKFVSSDFIPVKNESAVTAAALNGSIDQLIITNRGTGLTPGTYYVPIVGDMSSISIAQIFVPTTGTNAGRIESATIERVGLEYTNAKVLLTEAYSTAAAAVSRTGTSTSLGTTANVEAIISPPGGHGSNSVRELGAYRVMINKSLDFLDGDGDIPVDTQFRRFGLISDPTRPDGVDLTVTTATACNAIKFPAATTTNFAVGEIITQSTTGAKGRVIHWDSVTKVLRYYQNEYTSALQTGQNQYQLVPFSGSNEITGSESNITLTPDTTASGTGNYFGVTFTDGYSSPEVAKNSGNVIYVENRKAVNRSNDQIEDIKLVIEF